MPAVLMRLVALAALALTAGLASAQLSVLPLPGGVPGFPVSPVKIDPALSSVLQSAGFDQPIEAVLTFDHYPTATDLLALRAVGVQVRALREQVRRDECDHLGLPAAVVAKIEDQRVDIAE